MKISSEEALMLIESLRGVGEIDSWIDHCVCVGNCAGKIAQSLGLDEDYAKALGYVHDIGRALNNKSHTKAGYEYLKKLGYDEDLCNVCLTHSYLNNDVNCSAGGLSKQDKERKDFIKNHEYTEYEKIINICDLMCKTQVMTIEKRLIDLILRRGVHANTQYHIVETFKLKKYFDDKLGFNLYDLFPSIKDNL